jgi:hypothetical protein
MYAVYFRNITKHTYVGDFLTAVLKPGMCRMLFFPPPDRKEPAERSTRRCACVASYTASRGGLTVDDGS